MFRWPLAILLALALPVVSAGAVVAQSRDEEAEEAAPQRTLFERIGGTYVLAGAVDDFVDALLADPVIRANRPLRQALKPGRMAGLKFQITSLLCQEAGGPCKYQGRSMREAHTGLVITSREWAIAVSTFRRSLARAQVPPAEQQELFNIFETAKSDIVLTQRR